MTLLHHTFLFKNPLNYVPGRILARGSSNIISEMSDNDYRTYSDVADIDINMADDNGDPTAIDCIFLKTKKVRDYAMTPIGGSGVGFTGRAIPEFVTNYEGTDVRTTVSGFQHDLYILPNPITATQVRLQFSGTGVEIYAVMLLEIGQKISANERFSQIDFQKVDRTGSLTENPTGRTRRNPPFAGTRLKWDGVFTCQFREHSLPEFMAWTETNLNFAFVQEFSRYPARVYPATFPSTRMVNGYLNPEVKSVGEYLQFRVGER